jgi:hypothetical protein
MAQTAKQFFKYDPTKPFLADPTQMPDHQQPAQLQPGQAGPPQAPLQQPPDPLQPPVSSPGASPAPTPAAAAAPGASPAPALATGNPMASADDFFKANTPTRPVGAFTKIPDGQPGSDSWGNRHNVARGWLANIAAAFAEMGGLMNGHPGLGTSFTNRWNDADQDVRRFDADQGRAQAAARVAASGHELSQEAQKGAIAHTAAETTNLQLNNPMVARKQQFLAQLQQEAESGKYDPQALKARALRMARAGNVSVDPVEIDDLLQNTKPLGSKYQVQQDKNGRPEFITDRQGNRVFPDAQGKFADPEAQQQWDSIMQTHQQSIGEEENKEKRVAGFAAGRQAAGFAQAERMAEDRQQREFDTRRRGDLVKDNLALNSENQQYNTAVGLLKQATDAKNPNAAAAQAALFKTIGVDLPEGVHRMTDVELNRVANTGSAGQRLAGALKGFTTGVPFTDEIANQMHAVIDEVHKNKLGEHQANIDTINHTYGYQPPAQNQATPQTHRFSKSAWQKANPKGNANAAAAAAQQQGYEVTP